MQNEPTKRTRFPPAQVPESFCRPPASNRSGRPCKSAHPHLRGCRRFPQKSHKCPNIADSFRAILWFKRTGMRKYGKFAALIVIVIGTLVWLATAGMNETKTYYKTISELGQMKDEAYGKRLRVGGDVAAGSIQRVGNEVRFTLTQDNNSNLKVAYTGTDPLPDTFKDGAQALADGKLDKDGVFRASKIQAKCASKYEVKPGLKPGEAAPNINTGKRSI